MDELIRHEHDEELVCKVCLMSGQDCGRTAALNEVREKFTEWIQLQTVGDQANYGIMTGFVLALLTNLEKGK